MDNEPPQRPLAATIAAWIWIGIGIVYISIAIMTFVYLCLILTTFRGDELCFYIIPLYVFAFTAYGFLIVGIRTLKGTAMEVGKNLIGSIGIGIVEIIIAGMFSYHGNASWQLYTLISILLSQAILLICAGALLVPVRHRYVEWCQRDNIKLNVTEVVDPTDIQVM